MDIPNLLGITAAAASAIALAGCAGTAATGIGSNIALNEEAPSVKCSQRVLIPEDDESYSF